MGHESFDEAILVADSGTVIVRGSDGHERVWLGLSNGRDEDGEGDVVIELTEHQRRSISLLLDEYVQGAALNHAEDLAKVLESLLGRLLEIDDDSESICQEAEAALGNYRAWITEG